MGQKVNPIGLRLGINRTWDSRWYSGKNDYGKLLHEDMKIRKDLSEALKQAAVSKIVIERPHKKCRVTVHSARPGVVIGKKGADIEKLRKSVAKLTDSDVVINIVEIRKPELDATLVAESIAQQLERRVAFGRGARPRPLKEREGQQGYSLCCNRRKPSSARRTRAVFAALPPAPRILHSVSTASRQPSRSASPRARSKPRAAR